MRTSCWGKTFQNSEAWLHQVIYKSVKMGEMNKITHGKGFPDSFTGFSFQSAKSTFTWTCCRAQETILIPNKSWWHFRYLVKIANSFSRSLCIHIYFKNLFSLPLWRHLEISMYNVTYCDQVREHLGMFCKKLKNK